MNPCGGIGEYAYTMMENGELKSSNTENNRK